MYCTNFCFCTCCVMQKIRANRCGDSAVLNLVEIQDWLSLLPKLDALHLCGCLGLFGLMQSFREYFQHAARLDNWIKNRCWTRYAQMIECNAMIAPYLCLRHRSLAKEIQSHHYFDVLHQIGSWTSKSQSNMPANNARYLSAV